MLARDSYRCQVCGAEDPTGKLFHIDHIIPASKGGGDEDENLQTMCAIHNLKKGAKTGPMRVAYRNPRWLDNN